MDSVFRKVLHNMSKDYPFTFYGDLATHLDCAPINVANYFIEIDQYFLNNGLPPFSTLIVNSKDFICGDGYFTYWYPHITEEIDRMNLWDRNKTILLKNQEKVKNLVLVF